MQNQRHINYYRKNLRTTKRGYSILNLDTNIQGYNPIAVTIYTY